MTERQRAWCRRVIARHADRHGRRFVLWGGAPRHLYTPRWWRWTIELAFAVAAAVVAERCAREGIIRLYPARLDI